MGVLHLPLNMPRVPASSGAQFIWERGRPLLAVSCRGACENVVWKERIRLGMEGVSSAGRNQVVFRGFRLPGNPLEHLD